MIIQVLANLCDEGYLEKEEDSLISLFFSGANVAFRREVFNQIGLYDTNCHTGEDQDISIRINNTDWELYFQPGAAVEHKCRRTVKAFIKQWYRYGFYHPYLFKKHHSKSLTLYQRKRKTEKGALYKPIIKKNGFPLHAFIYASPFLMMNLLFFLTILTLSLGLNMPAVILGVVSLISAVYYFIPDVEVRRPLKTIQFVLLRYMANLALLIGGLWGGMKQKMIYVSATIDYKR